MKIIKVLSLMVLCMALTGCRRSSDDVWDDTKTAGRHMKNGIGSLFGRHGESRQVCSREDFMSQDRNGDFCYQSVNEPEYISLSEEADHRDMRMSEIKKAPRPVAVSPGDPGSHIPGIESFKAADSGELAKIFKVVYFPYNSSLVKGDKNLEIVRNIADYMKKHENTYIFVEGHCDERGAEAYNLALGARRSNSVRNLLIKQGVGPDNIFTVSYGKEKPLVDGHDEASWAKNRRSEFKIYQE